MGKVYWIAVIVIALASWRRGMRWPQLLRLIGAGLVAGVLVTVAFRMILRGQSILGIAIAVVVFTSGWFWPTWARPRPKPEPRAPR